MRSCIQTIQASAAAFGLLAMAAMCPAQDVDALKKEVALLKQQNKNLQSSLTEANRSQRETSEQLEQVRIYRFGFAGKVAFDEVF